MLETTIFTGETMALALDTEQTNEKEFQSANKNTLLSQPRIRANFGSVYTFWIMCLFRPAACEDTRSPHRHIQNTSSLQSWHTPCKRRRRV